MIQACAGVGYAHRTGLVHCDVKPHNMIVTPDHRLKVTDFGIARALASIHAQEVNQVVWGSPQYFSPEQASGYPPSPASDVYSLGIILYEMLAGRLPFIANSAAELSRMHRSIPPAPPSQFNPLVPPDLERVCLKVLSKEPSSRYRTADQLGRVLISLSRSNKASSQVISQTVKIPTSEINRSSVQTSPTPLPSPLPENIQSADKIAYFPAKPKPASRASETAYTSNNTMDIDWLTWGLVLLAVITLGGLVPMWVWIYMLYNPPGG
jgi:serine/threonine protein kinase